jgi:hypothetical protein
MKQRFNIDKLTERINLVSEYKYYNPKPEELNEAPEDENQNAEDQPQAGDDIEDATDTDAPADDQPTDDTQDGADDGGDDLNAELADEIDFDAEGGEDIPADDMGGGDEVEVDVTEITDGIDQNSEAIDGITQKIDSIATTFNQQIEKMMKHSSQVMAQVSQMEKNMEQQFLKRVPTPNEELMLQSLSSYPYNQKLTDYWKPAAGKEYDYSIENGKPSQEPTFDVSIKSNDEDEKPEEFVLTDKDVDDSYSESNVKQSFNYNNMKLR